MDFYSTSFIAKLSGVLADSKRLSLSDAERSIIGILAALPIPGLGVPSRFCKGDRLQQPAIVEICPDVARAFERGDTILSEMVGASIAMRVWPEGSPDWKAAAQEREVYRYRSKFGQALATHLTEDSAAKRCLALNAQYHREQDVWRAQLLAAGDSPDPPAYYARMGAR